MIITTKLLLRAIAIGVGITLALFGLSYLAATTGHSQLSAVFYWQGWGLQVLVPAPNIGTSEQPLYEATPLHLVAFFAGLPLGVVIYSVVVGCYMLKKENKGKSD